MSLNCVFCKKSVFGLNGITVPGLGPAHQSCYQANMALKRTFQKLDISKLSDEEFADLKDLVLAEDNDRRRRLDKTNDSEGDVELF